MERKNLEVTKTYADYTFGDIMALNKQEFIIDSIKHSK
jgi:hypothetical protein